MNKTCAKSILSDERVIIPARAISKSIINRVSLEYELDDYEENFIYAFRLDDLTNM